MIPNYDYEIERRSHPENFEKDPEEKLVQVSKEFHNGKFQRVGFYKKNKKIIIRPIK